MVWAAPSGLRFWFTVDQRTNDTSSVSGICEAYYISIHCEPLYPKCNRISFNKSKNMTLSSPIHRWQRHFVDCQSTRLTQMTKDFTRRHDENYVDWNGVSIKSYQFVTSCWLRDQTWLCIVGVKLPRVLSRRARRSWGRSPSDRPAARQHLQISSHRFDLVSSRLLILLVLIARFLWNMLRPQLHLLSLIVKTLMLGGLHISHCEQKTSNIRCTPSFDLLPDKVSKWVSIIRRVIYWRFDCSSQARQDFPRGIRVHAYLDDCIIRADSPAHAQETYIFYCLWGGQ